MVLENKIPESEKLSRIWKGFGELWKTQNEVEFTGDYPYCSEHGAMNKVSKHGMWRCLMCHIGHDEQKGTFLKNSTEGFKKRS